MNIPARLPFVAALPKTPAGKVNRQLRYAIGRRPPAMAGFEQHGKDGNE